MSATFEQWVQTVFDHPVSEPEWYWDEEFELLWEVLDLTDALTVRYLTRIFLRPEPLNRYSLEQVGQGICGVPGGEPELHWTCLEVMTKILDLPSELAK